MTTMTTKSPAPPENLPIGFAGLRWVLDKRKPVLPRPQFADENADGAWMMTGPPLEIAGQLDSLSSQIAHKVFCVLSGTVSALHGIAHASGGASEQKASLSKTLSMITALQQEIISKDLGIDQETLKVLNSHEVDGRIVASNIYQARPVINGGPHAAGILRHFVDDAPPPAKQ